MKKSQPVDSLTVNQKTLAKIFSVSLSTIVHFDREGLPSTKKGKQRAYHLPVVMAWYLERQLGKLNSLSEEQARFTKVKRERQELTLKKEQGEVILSKDAQTLFTELGLYLKGKLESLPHRLSGRLTGMSETRSISLLLKGEMKTVLSSFRSMQLQEASPSKP